MMRLLIGTVSAFALASLALHFDGRAAGAAEPAPTPETAGELFLTIQWCDTREAMVQVVDRHAQAGEAAANAAWDELALYGVCHTIDSGLPAIATLIEATHTTVVTMADPAHRGSGQPAVVEVWLAALEGISDQPVYIARSAMLEGGHLV
jgi:hypothetical protein